VSSIVDLIHAPGSDASPSPKPLSLVGALNALRRNEIEYPTADVIEGLVTVQPRPTASQPKRPSEADIYIAQAHAETMKERRVQERMDRATMAEVLRRKALMTADAGGRQRLVEAYAQLNGEHHDE
jgi:hypothetical protein